MFTVFQAAAQTAYVDESGFMTIEGRVTSTSRDEFEMSYDDENIVVGMDNVNDDTIETMIDGNIIKDGSFITVTGKIEEQYGKMRVNATSINVYTP